MIDPDTSSKLLITTRIRGLVKGAAEVDVGSLSEAEALDLLMATAGINIDDGPLNGPLSVEARGLATEVVNLCGRLALTVAIAGGMVCASGSAIDQEFVEVSREEGLREEEDEEGSDVTVEERVIKSSLTMIAKGGAGGGGGKKKAELIRTIL